MTAATRPGMRALIATIVSALLVSGCHTQQRIELPGGPSSSPAGVAVSQLKAGDTVQVTMKSGDKLSFPIQEVQSDGLVARGGKRFLYQDMARLDKRQLAKGKTAGLIAGITSGAFVILIAVGWVLYAGWRGLSASALPTESSPESIRR
jgi:hypothetical protein